VRYCGADPHEAEDAASAAVLDVLGRWADLENPVQYAHRAAVNFFLKERTRGHERLRRRLVAWGHGLPEAVIDDGLSDWEAGQTVVGLLRELPKKQKTIMALIVDGHTTEQIAALLRSSPATVRKNVQWARESLRRLLRPEGGEA
jgi:RNA polymerase sigma-70 factor (ECF subfamily)